MKVLRHLRSGDRDTQADIRTLAAALTRHHLAGMPWRAREAFDVIALLDTPAWAALLGLVDECPTIHGALTASRGSGVRSVSSTAFEFIAENSQIADVRQFMATLPERLQP